MLLSQDINKALTELDRAIPKGTDARKTAALPQALIYTGLQRPAHLQTACMGS